MEIRNFQDFVLALTAYWTDLGCIWSQPYDLQMGAGTFHPHTFLKGLGPEPWRSVYVQPCRRPVDGRYGKSTYRFQHYYQLQVLLKPSPANIVDLFLKSLEKVGIQLKEHDVGLLEDDWKGPTLGAWGLGWEVRANGQEVTQFTYFQQLGGLDLDVVSGEITYGTERLYMYSKGISNALEMPYNDSFTYGDIFFQNEFEFSHFNFKQANVAELFAHFDICEKNVTELCEKNLVLPAYDYVLQASHAFNVLDARGAISVSERQRFIGRVRDCAKKCALVYVREREKLGFPMQARLNSDARNYLLPGGKCQSPAAIPAISTNEDAGAETIGCLLVELGVEEMPPSFQWAAETHLREKWEQFLKDLKETASNEFKKKLDGVDLQVCVSARRLALIFKNVPRRESDRVVEVWGPAERIARKADGSLSPAGEGFCKKNDVNPADVTFKERGNSAFLFVEKKVAGRSMSTLLVESTRGWFETIPAPLKMKWLPVDIAPPFIRPVRWVVALADDRVIPCQMFGLHSGRKTSGQRILSGSETEIQTASDYLQILKNLKVEPDQNCRMNEIASSAKTLAEKAGGVVVPDEGLLRKCCGLSESPDVFFAEFDKKYLALPSRLITSVLREHMNYFSVSNQKGELLPYYIGVASYLCGKKDEMIAATKNVVVGRLDDGAFYFDEDLKTPIRDLREGLKAQMFQGGMGTLWQKTERLSVLCDRYGKMLTEKQRDRLSNFSKVTALAGEYCKADLRTGCVQEFPDEMQGLMGEIIISKQQSFGADSALVAKAIGEHYLPAGANSPLPTSLLGCVLSLADKMDSLAMYINSGVDVKGNKDPFGLRRQALAILRLVGLDDHNENTVGSSLRDLVDVCLDVLRQSGWTVGADTHEKMMQFFTGRLRSAWRECFNVGAVEAVCAKIDFNSVVDARKLAEVTTNALSKQGEGSFVEAILPYKRSRNLTQQLHSHGVEVKPGLFVAKEESQLFESVCDIEKRIKDRLSEGDYSGYIEALTDIGKPLAKFFDSVMVNDPDESLKANRLALLMHIRGLYEHVADFSLVQV